MKVLIQRLLSRFDRRRWETELDEELQFHLDMETERNVALGMSREEARRAARMALGGVESTKEIYRDQKGLPAVEELSKDIRYGLRLLVRDRLFTCVAIATLALGIGANTAIFSIIDGVLLEPLPFAGADRIVTVWEDFSAVGGPELEWIEVPNFFEWRKETDLFETMVAYGGGAVNLTRPGGEAKRLSSLGVTYGFFSTFGVTAQLGRTFESADDQPGADPVVILADEFWRREYGADAGILGASLDLSGVATRVIGIAPAGFSFPGTPSVDLWTPLRLDPAKEVRESFFLQGIARVREGVSVETAKARLDVLMEAIGKEFPENRGTRMQLIPLHEQIVKPVKTGFYVLFGVVMLVLLITCANIANLMLSRGTARAREFAIRTALGAGQSRLLRQLLTESLTLAVLGSLCGVMLARFSLRALVARIPADVAPRLENVTIDGTVLGFVALLAVVASLIFGLAPALVSFRFSIGSVLKEGGRGTDQRGGRLRATLATAQIGLALCLVICSGLALRSFVSLGRVDPGFEPNGITTASLTMPSSWFAGGPELVAFMDTLLEVFSAPEQIDSVAAISVLPLSGDNTDTDLEIEGRAAIEPGGKHPAVWFRRITPDYFRTMGQVVVRGREFGPSDRADSPPVVMISEFTAQKYWPGEDALGQRVRFAGDQRWHEIVGITGDVRHAGLETGPGAELYFPFAQKPGRSMTIVAKSQSSLAVVAQLLRSRLREVNPSLPLSSISAMATRMVDSIAQPRFFMELSVTFGLLALALAAVGVYGTMSFAVGRRSSELGIRMALGASRTKVLSLVLGDGLRLAAVGILCGLVVAWWATSYLSSLLFSIPSRDLVTFAGAAIVLTVVSIAACLLPASRATTIDPASILRFD